MPELQDQDNEKEVIINDETELDEKGKESEAEEGVKKDEESEGGEEEKGFDESNIDPEVRDYKPSEKSSEEEDEIDAEDKARIEKIVEKKYGGDIEAIKKQVAVDTYFNSKPEMARYKAAAMKYMDHPAYKGIPVHNIVAIVASKDMMKIGAAKEREAQRKIAETKSPGTTVRKPAGGTIDWGNVSKAEFDAQKAKVLGRMGN